MGTPGLRETRLRQRDRLGRPAMLVQPLQVPAWLQARVHLLCGALDEGFELAVRLDKAHGAQAMLLTPAHQFPLGSVLSPRRRADAARWAAGSGVRFAVEVGAGPRWSDAKG